VGLRLAEDARIEKDALAHRSANGGAGNAADKTEPEEELTPTMRP
jgi:hypothetical protein